MNLNVFWACILLICLWRVYIEIHDPAKLKIAKRIIIALIVALTLTAALMADEGDAATNAIVRGHSCAGGWLWCPW